MWPFTKKRTITQSNLLAGGTDHHSHILPGVDDGIATMKEALQALQALAATGIKELWLTPHIMEDYPNTPAALQENFATLQGCYTGPITLHLAAEYMIDNQFHELLDSGNLLPIGNTGNHLLVETSYFTPPMQLNETLQRIKSKGYHPLLAHPERYIYMEEKQYRELRENGVKFQLNMISLSGGYGREVQKKAAWLLKNNMYTVAGSDLHSRDALTIINNTPVDTKQSEALRELFSTSL
ncbi:MAG: capsular biosynthesis protein [Bacteroidaceae bacterium]|nr:capsular biosynthesis protein [Bacteroidaceae bacterium]